MFYGVLSGLVVATHLACVGLLLLLCIRTRSKGLMIIFITYITFAVIDAISKPLLDSYIGGWSAGETINWLTDSMSIGEFVMRLDLVKRFIYHGLISFGLFLIYKEWRRGKFNYAQPVPQEEPNT